MPAQTNSGYMSKTLIAVLGMGKGTWGHVGRLIQDGEWKKIILIGGEFSQENFKPTKKCEWVVINPRTGFDTLKDAIKNSLPAEELAVSIISGTGREHTALLSALRETKHKYKLVVLTGEGIKEY